MLVFEEAKLILILSVSLDEPLLITMLPGGGSEARAR
jgi:hypothetical protein